jgi:hypothetical protein
MSFKDMRVACDGLPFFIDAVYLLAGCGVDMLGL